MEGLFPAGRTSQFDANQSRKCLDSLSNRRSRSRDDLTWIAVIGIPRDGTKRLTRNLVAHAPVGVRYQFWRCAEDGYFGGLERRRSGVVMCRRLFEESLTAMSGWVCRNGQAQCSRLDFGDAACRRQGRPVSHSLIGVKLINGD
jgi:hypothetical protein